MSRLTVDFEKLMYQLLTADLPDIKVAPSVDVDSITDLPLLVFTGTAGHMISNGTPALGWEWTLALSLFTADRDTGSDLADLIYQTVHGFDDRKAAITGVGGVSSVDDESMFTRSAIAELDGALVEQYDAAFTVRVRPA